MKKDELKKKYGEPETPVDGSIEVTPSDARKLLRMHNNKVESGNVDSFVVLKNINKVYPNGVQAVFDFNLDIEAHDFVVLVGPSGCGKGPRRRDGPLNSRGGFPLRSTGCIGFRHGS